LGGRKFSKFGKSSLIRQTKTIQISIYNYCIVKKFGKKGYCKVLAKKLWRMLACITNFQSSINNKTKLNDAIPNIDEHKKRTLYFPGFILCHMLVACCLMIVRCTVESMICGCHQYVSKILFESELDLLKCYNIDILTLILTQNKSKRTSRCCACLMLQNRKIGKKSWQIVVIHQIHQSFFPSKVFCCMV